MKNGLRRAESALAVLILVSATAGVAAEAPRLRLLTFNAWSGLDYVGLVKMGEYEPADRREARFASFVAQAKALDPDVIFLQEANPVGEYAHRLASALGMTEIHQVVNGGIKLGRFGLPTNLKEGNAILAKPALGLGHQEDWKLSGPLGLFGDTLTVHLSEAVFALAGRITVGSTTVYLVDVHLVAGPPDDDRVLRRLRELPEGRSFTDQEFGRAVAETQARAVRRSGEMALLTRGVGALPGGAPLIVAGDFNTDAGSPQMSRFLAGAKLIDALEVARRRSLAGGAPPRTWDPARNDNVAYSMRPFTAVGEPLTGYDRLDALASTIPQRLDFILLGPQFREEDVLSARLALDEKRGGVCASDHFGVAAEIDLTRAAAAGKSQAP
jgi:endonuclease/exonuclease/phosphatase family metal-dependent hydrolase